MKATRYFEKLAPRKRPYLRRGRYALASVAEVAQPDGRLRRWVRVDAAPPDGAPRFLRLVLLDDGETVHNAFFDRNVTPPAAEGAP